MDDIYHVKIMCARLHFAPPPGGQASWGPLNTEAAHYLDIIQNNAWDLERYAGATGRAWL